MNRLRSQGTRYDWFHAGFSSRKSECVEAFNTPLIDPKLNVMCKVGIISRTTEMGLIYTLSTRICAGLAGFTRVLMQVPCCHKDNVYFPYCLVSPTNRLHSQNYESWPYYRWLLRKCIKEPHNTGTNVLTTDLDWGDRSLRWRVCFGGEWPRALPNLQRGLHQQLFWYCSCRSGGSFQNGRGDAIHGHDSISSQACNHRCSRSRGCHRQSHSTQHRGRDESNVDSYFVRTDFHTPNIARVVQNRQIRPHGNGSISAFRNAKKKKATNSLSNLFRVSSSRGQSNYSTTPGRVRGETKRKRDKRDGGLEAKKSELHKKRAETNAFIVSNNYCGSSSTEEAKSSRLFLLAKFLQKAKLNIRKSENGVFV